MCPVITFSKLLNVSPHTEKAKYKSVKTPITINVAVRICTAFCSVTLWDILPWGCFSSICGANKTSDLTLLFYLAVVSYNVLAY